MASVVFDSIFKGSFEHFSLVSIFSYFVCTISSAVCHTMGHFRFLHSSAKHWSFHIGSAEFSFILSFFLSFFKQRTTGSAVYQTGMIKELELTARLP